MQDEVLKHTQKIHKIARNSDHSFAKKLKEILIEIFIIVFAVTLSIWLHNWSEHRSERAEARDFFADLRNDLNKDIQILTERKKYLNSTLNTYSQINSFTQQQLDTASNVNLDFRLSSLKTNDGNYEGFKSSGKIGLIENKKLKKLILQYYEESLPDLHDISKYHYTKNLETLEIISSFDRPQNKLLSAPAFRTKINLDGIITQAFVTACDQTIEQATEISKEIDHELD